MGGDLNSGSTIYSYNFMPITDFLMNVDFEGFGDAAKTLAKAVEYSNCRIDEKPPRERWEPAQRYHLVAEGTCGSNGYLPITDIDLCKIAAEELGIFPENQTEVYTNSDAERPEGCYRAVGGDLDSHIWLDEEQANQGKGTETSFGGMMRYPICYSGEFGCRCIRKCENGGVLDMNTCTCKCRGNALHGWTGPECKETYGRCQAGPGSKSAYVARTCAVHNRCDSLYTKHLCSPTDVCCATDFGTTCCPYGSQCYCEWNKCSCRPPASKWLKARSIEG
eukprot:TRINITY_DN1755_c0_g1_i1.p2 TRINITY_DN1755_c0_g1~~TRINITY_DN1755_c0_g1_i1.p2  ORF type:complete len:278 (+),score=45.37 TRINITY_DN1755_c0_g1_i1:1078-1911(+)